MVQPLARSFLYLILLASLLLLTFGSNEVGLQHVMARSLPATVVQSAAPIAVSDGSHALNWAGYVALEDSYTSVSGSWIVPHAEPAGKHSADATWVGIGGVLKDDLIQAGTEALPDSDGSLSYQAWMETLPGSSHVIPLDVAPGDVISVSIQEQSPELWQISFGNGTTGQTYRTTVRYTSSHTSAEWIEEMPVEIGGALGLDDFGAVNFINGYAVSDGRALSITDTDAQALIMMSGRGEPLAAPSEIGGSGSSFTVSRLGGTATPLMLAEGGARATLPESDSQDYSPVYSVSSNTDPRQSEAVERATSYVFFQF